MDDAAMEKARERQAQLAKPPGSLGRLEDLSVQLAGITGQVHNKMEKTHLLVFAADNGVVAEGVSCAPQSVTVQQAVNMTRHKTGMSALAAYFGDQVQVVDVGICVPVSCPQVLDRKVRFSTGDIAAEPAMTEQEALRALSVGLDLAHMAKEEGIDAVGVGEMGIGNTTTSAAVLAALTGASVEEVAGRGGGLTDGGFATKKRVLRQALALHHPDPGEPVAVLAAVGGLDLAAMTGLFLGCAHEGLAAAVDGYISIVAACAPCGCVPGCGIICSCPTPPMRSATGWQPGSWGWSRVCCWACAWARAAGVPCCSGYCRGPARCWTGWPPSRRRPLRTNI